MKGWLELVDPAALERLGDGRRADLLRLAMGNAEPPPLPRRVFTNRNLRLEKIRFVGFDLDWTLANYAPEAMSETAFALTLERMIAAHGYPAAARAAEYRPGFARRGLIVDREAGTVLKMNRHRYVGRAYFGREFFAGEGRVKHYRSEPINPSADRFYFVDTLFELPEVSLFAELVELGKQGRLALDAGNEPYARLFGDVRAAIDSIHADGSLKRVILGDLARFLPDDPLLVPALERLTLGGRRLLLVTNSEWYFTDGICRHLFEGRGGVGSWRELFDLVVVSARKPGFFRSSKPFVELDESGEPVGEVETPSWGKVFAGGGREGLMRLLDAPGERMLYVGDHIYGDIFSSKRSSTWRTALVLQELESELESRSHLAGEHRRLELVRSELSDFGQRMDDLKDVLALAREVLHAPSDAPTRARLEARLERMRDEHRVMRDLANRLQEQISEAINPYWGSVFKQGSNKSLFGAQVDDFACVYTSRVSNFAAYGGNHYYRVLRDAMMHESEP